MKGGLDWERNERVGGNRERGRNDCDVEGRECVYAENEGCVDGNSGWMERGHKDEDGGMETESG